MSINFYALWITLWITPIYRARNDNRIKEYISTQIDAYYKKLIKSMACRAYRI